MYIDICVTKRGRGIFLKIKKKEGEGGKKSLNLFAYGYVVYII